MLRVGDIGWRREDTERERERQRERERERGCSMQEVGGSGRGGAEKRVTQR